MIRLYWIILLLMLSAAVRGQQDSTAISLKNVVVTGKAGTKSVTAERTRINPGATMSSATGSVLEVLRSSSAVTVDGSGQVSIRGNSNVLILVDGVPTTLDGQEPEEDLTALAQRLKANYPRTQFYTSHCTGDSVYERLKSVMGEQLQSFRCGTIIETA